MGPDLTTAIVVGAVVGLFFVALGHAQLVWLARRKRAPSAAATRGSPLRTLLGSAAALAAALALVHAATARTLPDRPALLAGEDLLVLRAKPGLVAAHATRSADVRRGETLLRFAGQSGDEARTAIRARRQQAAVQLASERMRPLDYDGEMLRRAETARGALREHERRLAQLVTERDGVERELAAQRLALESRRYRVEGDDRDAARELEPLAASLATERNVLAAQESLAARRLIAPIDAERARDAVAKLEGRVRQLQDRRVLLARERADLSTLRSQTLATLDRQLAARASEQQLEREEIVAARRELALASEALETDRPRAEAERRKRLEELERQLAEWDALLDGRGALAVTSPWDGRIGFREPVPETAPADGGPLLVAYRPGAIAAAVRVEPSEADAARAPLQARVVVAVPGITPDVGGPAAALEVEGRVVGRATLPDGAVELRVACDPPDRVVRRLAMGGTVPVVARLQRGLLHVPSFQLAVALALVAAAFAIYDPLRRRLARRRRRDRDDEDDDDRAGTSTGRSVPTWDPAVAHSGASAWPRTPALPPAAADGSAGASAGAPS